MSKGKMFGWFAGLAMSVLVAPQAQVFAQGSVHASTKAAPTFESRLWSYLLTNNYKNWAPPAGQGGGYFRGEEPHGKLQKIYLNRTAAAHPDSLDDESLIVLENYRSNKTLESIAVMLRSEGSHPSVNDWCWIVYGPDGSVRQSTARKRNKTNRSAGTMSLVNASSSGSSCVQCHQTAPGGDFVFFNRGGELRLAKEANVDAPR